MASPPGPSRPVAIGERAAVDEAADAHSPCASSSTTDALQPTQDTRPWQETDSRQQRCCRNLDCLSPILDGRNSTAHDPQGPTARRGSSATTTASLEGGQDDSRDSTADLEIPGMQPTQGTQSRHTVAPGPVETPTSISAANPSGWSATDSGQASLPCRTFFVMQNDGGSSRPSSSRRSQSYDTPSAVVTHSPPAPDDRRGSRPRMNRGGSPFRTGQPLEDGRARPQSRGQAVDGRSTECVLPRWQPDAEVTYCPICHAQFSIFVRKHHCRKCGRVVCNSCSPHRIIIPHPYIVRPPGSGLPMPSTLLLDGLGAGYFEASGPSGGERVRLCNPCVPDPNTAPPQSSASSVAASPRSSHQRSRSNHGTAYGAAHSTSAYAAPFPAGRGGDAYQYYSPRWRSVTMGPAAHGGQTGTSAHQIRISTTYHSPLERYLAGASSSTSAPSRRNRHSSFGEAASSPRHRALPPPPQIAEEDECPICHGELPSRELPDSEALRESHVSSCIQSHSTYGSPRAVGGESALHPAPRRTGMYTYAATEKDCIDDAECTICLEEFTAGVAMARLECLCRFHKACISAWFVDHPGRCPVHQHDGFGF